MAISPDTQPIDRDDALEDFDPLDLTLLDQTRRVYVAGSGPAVIVMHEMPGISPQVARFARWVRDAGFTVFMPSLFGRDGAVPQAEEGAQVFQRVCVSREFRVMAGSGASPVVDWLRALARHAHDACGGPGVGAVGMCLTGNFALSLLIEPTVRAPVVCQPSTPLDDPAAISLTDEEVAALRARLDRDDLTALAYRFEGDRFCSAARFEAYRRKLGDRFDARVLPDEAANRTSAPFFATHIASPHSVVTQHLINGAGEPTRRAVDDIIGFLHQRLTAG